MTREADAALLAKQERVAALNKWASFEVTRYLCTCLAYALKPSESTMLRVVWWGASDAKQGSDADEAREHLKRAYAAMLPAAREAWREMKELEDRRRARDARKALREATR